ncbi:CB069-like protein [Mya arenaria]|uniref:CB069-like protein n=1 Tax=Mya arenaria TaxID=6604 RepID=A0ABY7D966_MYAAR|nr:mitochondrial protein C2orf69-like [Mya arenaria]WAQ94184.1 CB069-like protein [Mya arenaria]
MFSGLKLFQNFKEFQYIIVTFMACQPLLNNSSSVCRRMKNVIGDKDKRNDVVFCTNPATKPKQHIILFGGDVQDYKENMNLYNPQYSTWDVESSAQIIHARFPDSAVFVVKPAQMLLNTFSIYKNFLNFDEDGRPEFNVDFGALIHLAKLYTNVVKQIEMSVSDGGFGKNSQENSASGDYLVKSEATVEKGNDDSICDRNSDISEKCQLQKSTADLSVPVRLMGFSKGCVVINQMVFELKAFKDDKDVRPFLDKVMAIYWLDGGHIGTNNAYITDYELLGDVVALNKELHVHVTPYQILDPNRPWIGIEETEFVQRLKNLKGNIHEFKHFMNMKPSIKNHFKVITQV